MMEALPTGNSVKEIGLEYSAKLWNGDVVQLAKMPLNELHIGRNAGPIQHSGVWAIRFGEYLSQRNLIDG